MPCVAEGTRDRFFQYHLGENVFNPHWEASVLPDRLWLEKSEFAFQNFFFFFLVPEIKRNKVQTVQPQASCGLGIWHPNGLLCSRRCFLPYLGVARGSPDEFHCLPHHAVHEAVLESGLKVKKAELVAVVQLRGHELLHRGRRWELLKIIFKGH